MIKKKNVINKNFEELESLSVIQISDLSSGLIFIENPFTAAGQRSWITRCVKDYSKKPNKTNLDAHNIIKDDENWWEICYGCVNKFFFYEIIEELLIQKKALLIFFFE